jgi:glycosyltransferase involved in cell wall biosynthesis
VGINQDQSNVLHKVYNRYMFASLCILAYKRPEQLQKTLDSLLSTIDYPCEIIVNVDGDEDKTVYGIASKFYSEGKISKLILNNGKNRGVGRSFQNCIGVAEGDYIFKIDADLTFHPKWLSQAVKILDTNSEVGAVGLFDYNKWDQNDSRFKPEENVLQVMKTWEFEYQIVKDFVSSIYGFRKKYLDNWIGDIPDDGFHTHLEKLAINHSVDNTAFGVVKSTYVSGTEDHPYKTPTYTEPLLFSEK